MDVNSYKSQLWQLLPQGTAWPREAGSELDNTVSALAEELTRADTRVGEMLDESYPLLAASLLTDWETTTGVKNDILGMADTLQGRREAVFQKLSSRGGQSRKFFIALAKSIGYDITISEIRPFKAGHSKAGDAVYDDEDRHVWVVNAPQTTVRPFKSGQAGAGEPLRTWGNERLESVIKYYKPAQTTVIFSYQ